MVLLDPLNKGFGHLTFNISLFSICISQIKNVDLIVYKTHKDLIGPNHLFDKSKVLTYNMNRIPIFLQPLFSHIYPFFTKHKIIVFCCFANKFIPIIWFLKFITGKQVFLYVHNNLDEKSRGKRFFDVFKLNYYHLTPFNLHKNSKFISHPINVFTFIKHDEIQNVKDFKMFFFSGNGFTSLENEFEKNKVLEFHRDISDSVVCFALKKEVYQNINIPNLETLYKYLSFFKIMNAIIIVPDKKYSETRVSGVFFDAIITGTPVFMPDTKIFRWLTTYYNYGNIYSNLTDLLIKLKNNNGNNNPILARNIIDEDYIRLIKKIKEYE